MRAGEMMGGMALSLMAGAAMSAAQAAAAHADRCQDHAYAAATVEGWQRALAEERRALEAEQERTRRLVSAVRDLQAENDELDDALATAAEENETLRAEIAELRRRSLRRVS